jgi:hypothetical protein
VFDANTKIVKDDFPSKDASAVKKGAKVFEERGEVMGIGVTEFLFLLMIMLAWWMMFKRRNRNHDHKATPT